MGLFWMVWMVVQRKENQDQCCLQHVPRRSRPLNLNMERSLQTDVLIMSCCPSVFWFIEWVLVCYVGLVFCQVLMC
jgi:hypothetical protein